jgi:N-acetylneuraminate synthase
MKVPAYKVASFEIVDLALIEKIARTGKPVILSTGMATFDEIREAVKTVREAGNDQLALLKCTSAYPASPENMNLRTIPDMIEKFGLPVGLSDHTTGMAVPVAAASLGACMIEKHFTLDRTKGGPDSAFSLEPQEFSEMVKAVRTAEHALGTAHYGPSQEELKSIKFRRSLFVVQDVRRGDLFTEKNVRSIRPGYGLAPKYLTSVIGRRAAVSLQAGTPLQWDHVVDENGGRF